MDLRKVGKGKDVKKWMAVWKPLLLVWLYLLSSVLEMRDMPTPEGGSH